VAFLKITFLRRLQSCKCYWCEPSNTMYGCYLCWQFNLWSCSPAKFMKIGVPQNEKTSQTG